MIMEGPPYLVVPSLALWFADVMQQGCPTEPKVVGMLAYILQHFHRMVVVVLVSTAIACLYLVHRTKLRHNQFEQARIFEVIEATARMFRQHNLVHLIGNALTTDNFQSIGIARQRLVGLWFYLEIELGGKAHASHHTKRVVGERHIWVERCGNDAIFHVIDPIERIDQLAEAVLVETYS